MIDLIWQDLHSAWRSLRKTSGVGGAYAPFCTTETVQVGLAAVPAAGLHLLQIQNGDGPISTEVPFCVGPNISGCL